MSLSKALSINDWVHVAERSKNKSMRCPYTGAGCRKMTTALFHCLKSCDLCIPFFKVNDPDGSILMGAIGWGDPDMVSVSGCSSVSGVSIGGKMDTLNDEEKEILRAHRAKKVVEALPDDEQELLRVYRANKVCGTINPLSLKEISDMRKRIDKNDTSDFPRRRAIHQDTLRYTMKYNLRMYHLTGLLETQWNALSSEAKENIYDEMDDMDGLFPLILPNPHNCPNISKHNDFITNDVFLDDEQDGLVVPPPAEFMIDDALPLKDKMLSFIDQVIVSGKLTKEQSDTFEEMRASALGL